MRGAGGRATYARIPNYDAIVFVTPARFGNMAAHMCNFLDQTGNLFASSKLIGKFDSILPRSGPQHGGTRDDHQVVPP